MIQYSIVTYNKLYTVGVDDLQRVTLLGWDLHPLATLTTRVFLTAIQQQEGDSPDQQSTLHNKDKCLHTYVITGLLDSKIFKQQVVAIAPLNVQYTGETCVC